MYMAFFHSMNNQTFLFFFFSRWLAYFVLTDILVEADD